MRGKHQITVERYVEVDLALTLEEFDLVFAAVSHFHGVAFAFGTTDESAVSDLVRSLREVQTSIRTAAHDRVRHEASVIR